MHKLNTGDLAEFGKPEEGSWLMENLRKFRDRFERCAAELSKELDAVRSSDELGDFGVSQWFSRAKAHITDFQLTLRAWQLLHPGFRYLILLGRTSSGKSSVGNCLLKHRNFETNPNEQTARLEFAAEPWTLEKLKTISENSDFDNITETVGYIEAIGAPKHLVIVDTPGFGTNKITVLQASKAKELLLAILPLIDHVIYITQPNNPLNDIDEAILGLLGNRISWVPFTIVLAKLGDYRLRKASMPSITNFDLSAFKRGQANISAFFAQYRAEEKDQITFGKNLFVVETELPELPLDTPETIVPNGITFEVDSDVAQNVGSFSEDIDTLRNTLFGSSDEREGLEITRRKALAARWSEIVDSVQEGQEFFVERTAASEKSAIRNEKEFLDIVELRVSGLREFWSKCSNDLLKTEQVHKDQVAPWREASSQAAAKLDAALIEMKKNFSSEKEETWSKAVRERIESQAAERAQLLEGAVFTAFESYFRSLDLEQEINPDKIVSDLRITTKSALDAAKSFQVTLGVDYFEGVDVDLSFSKSVRNIVEIAIKDGLLLPCKALGDALNDSAILKEQERHERNFRDNVENAIKAFKDNFRLFRTIVRLRASEEDEKVVPLVARYEQAFGHQIRHAVSDEGPSLEEGDRGATNQRLRRIVDGPIPNPGGWRKIKSDELLQIHNSTKELKDRIDALRDLVKASPPSPKPRFDTVRHRVGAIAREIDGVLRNMLEFRCENVILQIRSQAEALKRMRQLILKMRRRAYLQGVGISTAVSIIIVAVVYFSASDTATLYSALGALAVNAIFAGNSAWVVQLLLWIHKKFRGADLTNVLEPSLPSPGLIVSERFTVDQNRWHSDPMLWEPLTADISNALSSFAKSTLDELTPHVKTFTELASELNGNLDKYNVAATTALRDMRGRYTDTSNAGKFEAEAKAIRAEWTRSVYDFFGKRNTRLQAFNEKLKEVTFPNEKRTDTRLTEETDVSATSSS